jgi:hypothetical protein
MEREGRSQTVPINDEHTVGCRRIECV